LPLLCWLQLLLAVSGLAAPLQQGWAWQEQRQQ
jgi:hypothetical protein